MRIIAIRNLKEFYERHPETETGIKTWVRQVKSAVWENPNDVIKTFTHARPIGNGRVIFNLNKNDYRLIVKIEYRIGIVFVCFVGSHSDYDKIDPETIEKF